MDENKELFTLEEAAEYLSVPSSTVHNAYYKGLLKGETIGKKRKRVVITKQALHEYAATSMGKRGRPPTPGSKYHGRWSPKSASGD